MDIRISTRCYPGAPNTKAKDDIEKVRREGFAEGLLKSAEIISEHFLRTKNLKTTYILEAIQREILEEGMEKKAPPKKGYTC